MPYAPNPPDDFEPWETATIRGIVAGFFAARTVPPSISYVDLLQEAFIQWTGARSKYDASAGATRKTYLSRVITRRLISIEREWSAQKRGDGEMPSSLQEPIGDENEPDLTLEDLIAAPTYQNINLAIDLQQVIAQLTSRQQLIIAGMNEQLDKVSIADRLGVSRDTVNEDLKRIRMACAEAGPIVAAAKTSQTIELTLSRGGVSHVHRRRVFRPTSEGDRE